MTYEHRGALGTMHMCAEGHPQIVFDRVACPLCAKLKDIELLEKENLQLRKDKP